MPQPDAQPQPAPAAPESVIETTLEDFCRDLSASDRRVEMIAAFFSDEGGAGHHKDTPDNFAARYESFQRRPA
jgi:hypothetical protein